MSHPTPPHTITPPCTRSSSHYHTMPHPTPPRSITPPCTPSLHCHSTTHPTPPHPTPLNPSPIHTKTKGMAHFIWWCVLLRSSLSGTLLALLASVSRPAKGSRRKVKSDLMLIEVPPGQCVRVQHGSRNANCCKCFCWFH